MTRIIAVSFAVAVLAAGWVCRDLDVAATGFLAVTVVLTIMFTGLARFAQIEMRP